MQLYGPNYKSCIVYTQVQLAMQAVSQLRRRRRRSDMCLIGEWVAAINPNFLLPAILTDCCCFVFFQKRY